MSRRGGIILIAAIASLTAVEPARAAFPGTNGKIAFMSNRDGNNEIYTMNADGTGQTNISNNSALDQYPAWSADGSKIAFSSLRPGDGKFQVYKMNADGSGQTKVTSNPNWAYLEPSWSPNGSQIVMQVSLDSCCAPELVRINADGTNELRLTTNSTVDADPAWSPDGSKIAFSSNRDGNPEIYVMNPDGTGVTRLTNDPADDHAPDWSATGDTIAFTRALCTPACEDEIYTMPASGGTATDITNNPTDDRNAAFSPANTMIAFTRGAPTSGEIWTMSTTGSTPIQRTSNSFVDEYPDWQPAILGYPRPKSAGPLRVPLVPAYNPCSTPNRTHGPPLGFDSCTPPGQTSPNLTVGTPDANGAAAKSVGLVRLGVIVGVPGPPDDSDVVIHISLTDVRCTAGVVTCGSANASGGADYTGELELALDVRLSDRFNDVSPSLNGIDPATVTDFPIDFPVTCTATASTADGSLCAADTSIDNRYPGSMKDGKRAVWEIGQAKVFDGGPDGDVDTADNSLFEVQGLFVP